MSDVKFVLAWLDGYRAAVAAQVAELTELDRLAGDGDFGDNLHAALDRAAAALEAHAADQTISSVFADVATAFQSGGGTSGPLLGVWFREISRATRDLDEIDTAALATGVASGTQRVQKLGGAAEGDCTMVDAMVPAAQALAEAVAGGKPLSDALAEAATAADSGARATAAIIARKGRASYLGERAVSVEDPGARAIAMFFDAAGRVGIS